MREKKFWTGALIVLLAVGLVGANVGPAFANVEDPRLAVSVGVASTIVVAAIAYGVWENLPWRQDQPRWLQGEFYSGAYLGAAFTPAQPMSYNSGAELSPRNAAPFGIGSFNTSGQKFNPGVMGGLKLGYFCHRYPNFGLELETNFHPSRLSVQSVNLSRTIGGTNIGYFKSDDWVNWIMALHLVGRYGFLKDEEVPFGRLQPYLGIGPGMVVMYDHTDAAKNFSIDVMAGVRYMMTKNVAAFLEYKYDHQFNAEMEAHNFYLPSAQVIGTATLNVDMHSIVAGVSYHFH